MPQDNSNGLKHLRQLTGLPRSVLDFLRSHAGALYPAANVIQSGRQQDSPYICPAEQGRDFSLSLGLGVNSVDLPHSRNHLGYSGFSLFFRQLLDGLQNLPAPTDRHFLPLQSVL